MSFFVAPDTGAVHRPFGEDGGRTLAREYGVPFLGEIPLDPAIREASDEGTLVAAVGSAGQKAIFAGLAERLCAAVAARSVSNERPLDASKEE